MATTIIAEIADAIANAYRRLGDDVAVAVRSSGTTEDAGDSSFAGMNASFSNVIGLPNVLARVKDCWASLYGERVLAYRAEQHLAEEPARTSHKRRLDQEVPILPSQGDDQRNPMPRRPCWSANARVAMLLGALLRSFDA